MEKIRLLQFVNTLELGGATNYALTLCEQLDTDTFEIFLATGPGLGLEERAHACSSDVLYLNSMKPSHTKVSDNTYFGDVLAVYKLYQYLRKNRIDVIHSHGSKSRLMGGVAAWLARTPRRIQSAHGFSFNSQMPKWKFSIFLLIEKLMSRLYHELILESDSDINEADRRGLKGRKSCIYTGMIYESRSSTQVVEDMRAELGIDREQVMVLMVGRLTSQKDPHTFVMAAQDCNKRQESTVFVVVGDGDLWGSTNELAVGQERILLLGSRTDVSTLIDACDVFMLTSRWDGIPLTVLIAMNASKPVVATDKLGLPEVVIDNVTGLLASEGVPESYADCVEKLVESADMRISMGEQGKKLVQERHNISSMVCRFEEIFKHSIPD